MSKLIHAKSLAGFKTAFPHWDKTDTDATYPNSSYKSVVFTDDGYLYTHGSIFKVFDATTPFTTARSNNIVTFTDKWLTAFATLNIGISALAAGSTATIITTATDANGIATVSHATSTLAASTLGAIASSNTSIVVPKITTDAYGHLISGTTLFTATLNQVQTNLVSTNANYYLAFAANSSSGTSELNDATTLYVNPSTGALYANAFYESGGTLASRYAAISHTSVTATGSTLGHVKLQDTYDAVNGVSSGIAATPVAVNAALTEAKSYADGIIGANDAMVFKGVIDASTSPNYPTGNRGDTYKVSVAGKIGGASGPNVLVGDLIICTTDGSAAGTQAVVGTNWAIIQSNIDGAITSSAALAQGTILLGQGSQAITSLANSTAGYLLTCGGGTANPSWVGPKTFNIQVNGTTLGTDYNPTTNTKALKFTGSGGITLSTSTDTINIDSKNIYPTAFAWTSGSTAGPTGTLTVTGGSNVTFAAIDSASATVSGVVTTGAQTFAGAKTFSSQIVGSISGNAGTATSLAGGGVGSIPYQSAAGTTAFLAATTNNGYVLKYNTGTNAPYWAVDIDTDTHWSSKNIIGATSGAIADALVTSATNSVFLNHIENGSVTSHHNIVGTGSTQVSTDASGNLTIYSVNSWRNVTAYLLSSNLSAEILSNSISTADLDFGSEFLWDAAGGSGNGQLRLGWAEIATDGTITYTV